MKRTVLLSAAILCPVVAQAHQVYPGCAVPSDTPNHVWYVDPVNGKSPANGGDGSQAHPWDNLSGVIGTGAAGYPRPMRAGAIYYHRVKNAAGANFYADQVGNPPVQTGDEVLLMPGAYGDLAIGQYGVAEANLDGNGNIGFVTVAPAQPGTVTFTDIYLDSSSGWFFSGLIVQPPAGVTPRNNTLVTVTDQLSGTMPAHDVVFEGDSLSMPVNPDTMTPAEWHTMPGGVNFRSSVNNSPGLGVYCVSFVGNKVSDTGTSINALSDSTVIAQNELSYISGDVITHAGSGFVIDSNYFHDLADQGTGDHIDCTQETIGNRHPLHDVTIRRNVCIRQTDPLLASPDPFTNGYDTFGRGCDSTGANCLTTTNLDFEDNVLITAGCQGFVFAQIVGGKMLNNTAISDGAPSQASSGCKNPSMGMFGTNLLIANNVAATVGGTVDQSNTIVNNVALAGGSMSLNGVFINKPGTYVGSNTLTSMPAASEFVSYAPQAGVVNWAATNLSPAPRGDLYQRGACVAGVPSPALGGAPRCVPVVIPGTANIGAY